MNKKICPRGKVLNEKTGRCIKDNLEIKILKKTCPEGKILSKTTRRCVTGEKLFLMLNTYTMMHSVSPNKLKIKKEIKIIRDKIIKKGYEKELNRYDIIWAKILYATDSEKKEINDLWEISM